MHTTWFTIVQWYIIGIWYTTILSGCPWKSYHRYLLISECMLNLCRWYLYQARRLACSEKAGGANRLIFLGYCRTQNRNSYKTFLVFFWNIFSLLYRRASPLVCLLVSTIILLFFFTSAYVVRIWPQNTRSVHDEYEISVRLRSCVYVRTVCTVVDHFLLSTSET